jgi:glutamine synthetase adenylyltransferase
MKGKELKKLNRKQLLELLLKQTERADMLEAKLHEAEEKLNDRSLHAAEAGSMAEASLRLNGIFEAADAAAEQYLENIRLMSENQKEIIEAAEAEARKKAEEIINETEKKCKLREAKADKMVRIAAAKLAEMYAQKKSFANERSENTVKNENGNS